MKAEDNYCMGCMEKRTNGATCPICGYKHGTAPESPLYLPPGTKLKGKYLIGRVLGHGGFGITYLVFDIELHVKLAIKEFLPRDIATRSTNDMTVTPYTGPSKEHFSYGLNKFLEEARALARFEDSPGIVSVRDFFRANDTAYFVMHFVDGITFKEYLERNGGKIPFDRAVKILMPVMDALREVHSAKLLHRDISPDNIYITRENRIKLMDFGAARYATGEHSRSLSVMLKPGYAPEEQYRSKGKQGAWTDVYALAATLYRAVTGQVPLQATDRLYEDTVSAPSKLGVAIQPEKEAALMKALSIRADDRFQSIEDFQQALMEKPAPTLSHGDRYINSLGMEFVYIGPGSFMMGSPEDEKGRDDDEIEHKVTLTQGYWLQTTEVTQAQWKAVMGENPSRFKGDGLPVETVSWEDVQAFIKKLNQRGDEITYSLPTEAQWEYAARAGTTGPFAFGSCLSTDQANYDGNHPLSDCSKGKHRETTVAVGSFSPNDWGLYDMHGNVWEWCDDWKGDYPSGPVTDPTGLSTGSFRVLRGGSWNGDARICRSAYRGWHWPDGQNNNRGFRLAASPGR